MVKVLHAVIHVLALIFSAVGLKAVFDSHNLADKPIPNMYCLHSWLGIVTVTLFGMQVNNIVEAYSVPLCFEYTYTD